MKKFLLLFSFFISYCSYAQLNFNMKYSNQSIASSVSNSLSIEVNDPITVNYFDFPPQESSYFWLIIVPYKETHIEMDYLAGGGRLSYSDYIHGSNSWTTAIDREGKFDLLVIEGSNAFNFIKWVSFTITVSKKTLPTNDVPEIKKSSSIFPNPSNGMFTITPFKAISFVQVYDKSGTLILKTTTNQLDLTAQPDGIYFATIQYADGTFANEKIIVKP